MTVSRVLRGRGEAGEETIRMIKKVAVDLGYKPNAGARAIRSGRFGSIGLLISTVRGRSHPFDAIVAGVQKQLIPRNQHLNVAELPDEKLTSDGYVPKILKEFLVDGLIVNYTREIPGKMLALIHEHKIPSIWTNAKLDSNCVHPDDIGAGRLAVEYLAGLGHRDIAFYCGGYNPHYSFADRFNGYAAGMIDAGLTPVDWRPAEGDEPADAHARAMELLGGEGGPTAVVCYADNDALTLAYAAACLGRKLGEDLSLLVMNGMPLTSLGFTFDTVVIPFMSVGEEAVKCLNERIKHPKRDLTPRAVACEVSPGRTCNSLNSTVSQ
jgi:LacI family transcriptional regulator